MWTSLSKTTMSLFFDHIRATDTEIISRCHASGDLLSDSSCSNKVVKISSNIVVKYGNFVKEGEFFNQQIAFQLLDPNIVRVPAPYRFIQDGPIGYLVMDFAEGEVPCTKQALAVAPRLRQILSHMHNIRGETPGALSGGVVEGALWPNNVPIFKDRRNLEDWLTRRLKRPGSRISFEDQPLVMCHMDFSPRNLVICNSNKTVTVTLLDWSSAGYFPRIFDYIPYKFSPLDTGFFLNLEPHLASLSPQEKQTAKDVVQALENCQVFFFS
ncbi:uncharacterized protein PV09_09792 [Verruconis gallopava]|uniref:Aminoglycoside phosphotransferase domain-containing protein n=1 Tax=Verruconis gallopava TaxID=253628 RepID=A0A0D2AHF4_9PEZI|nr:uncharacterized protein PV09_09792 [Verruconis gallopava]KIV98373.1 hypothetical protein PV09_09792 [Verruconis gallopava]